MSDERLTVTDAGERDANGAPVFLVNGRKFFHQPCEFGRGNDHVWKSEHGDSLTFEGPGYEHAAYRSAGP